LLSFSSDTVKKGDKSIWDDASGKVPEQLSQFDNAAS
jgi:hypothetical protein